MKPAISSLLNFIKFYFITVYHKYSSSCLFACIVGITFKIDENACSVSSQLVIGGVITTGGDSRFHHHSCFSQSDHFLAEIAGFMRTPLGFSRFHHNRFQRFGQSRF